MPLAAGRFELDDVRGDTRDAMMHMEARWRATLARCTGEGWRRGTWMVAILRDGETLNSRVTTAVWPRTAGYCNRAPLENDAYTMDHSAIVYVMKAAGEFVGPIGYGEPDAQARPLPRDLVAELRPGVRSRVPADTTIERSAT